MLSYGGGASGAATARGGPQRPAPRIPCSQQSVLSAIDRFVRAVNNMDATVLVPSRLRDMEVQHQDLYTFYAMLKDVKNELLWGPALVSLPPGGSSPRRLVSTGALMGGQHLGPMMTSMTLPQHLRQPSDDGLGSSTGCSSDQDTDSDFESIVTDRESTVLEQTSHLATAFRHHLNGLHAILHQLADSADYLTNRYQEEIEGPAA